MSQVENTLDFQLPSDPNERVRYKQMMDQIIKAQLIIISQNDTITETCNLIKEEFAIPSEFTRSILKAETAENFNVSRQKVEAKLELADTYKAIFGKGD